MNTSMKAEATTAQAHALTLPVSGPVLIEANAGTGKTYTLVHTYVRLLLEKRLLPSQVLLLTFTRAATAELGLRLRQLLRVAWEISGKSNFSSAGGEISPELKELLKRHSSVDDREWLKWCLVSFDQAAIYTINGFCQRVLQEQGHLCDSPPLDELETAEDDRVREWLSDYWRRQEKTLGTSLFKLIQGAGVTLESMKFGNSDKALQTLVREKLNKTDFADINVPQMPDPKVFRAKLEDLRSYWQQHKSDLASKIAEAGISRAGQVDTLISQVDAFFDSGDISGVKLRLFNGLDKQSLPFKKGYSADDYPKDRFFEDFGRVLNDIVPLIMGFRYRAYEFVRRQFDQSVRTHGRYRYSDQIELVYRAVTGKDENAKCLRKAIVQQWPVVLLDEFQDTDLRQFEIFKSCYLGIDSHQPDTEGQSGNAPALIMVGDPKQAIYGFRGADVFVYQTARALLKKRSDGNQRLLSLTTNWRSTPELIGFVNKLFSGLESPFVLPDIGYQASSAPSSAPQPLGDPDISKPVVLWSANQADEGETPVEEMVINEIQRLLGEVSIPDSKQGQRCIQPHDMAVLVAKNNQAEAWYERLVAAGVPATLWSEQSVFETTTALELCDAMRAILRPDMAHVRAVMVGSLADFSLDELSEENYLSWQEDMIQRSVRWPSQGMAVTLAEILENETLPRGRAYAPWLKRIDGERRWTDFNHLIELLARREAEGCRGEKLLQWLADNVARKSKNDDSAKRRLQSDERGVAVMTLHKSKGLQFPVVFMPQLEKLTATKPSVLGKKYAEVAICHYHEQTDTDEPKAVTNWHGDESARQASFQENISERRRLLYVGMTRAERRLYLSYREPKKKVRELIFVPYLDLLQQDGFERFVTRKSPSAAGGSRAMVHKTASVAKNTLAARRFDALDKLTRVVSVSSFSALVSGEEREPLFETPDQAPSDAAQGQKTLAGHQQAFLSFPKGAKAGNCFHRVMEQCPLTDPESLSREVVEQALQQYGFLPTDNQAGQETGGWIDCLRHKAIQVCRNPLEKNGLCLQKADAHKSELEFLLPAKKVTTGQVRNWLAQHREKDVAPLRHEAVSGYLTGSIDLVFRHQDRYFVVDYKTNHLGFSAADYDRSALQPVIEAHHYDLQYLLYTAALVKFLRQQKPQFDYENDFGGVYYLFVRGIGLDPEQPQAGVYYDKPDQGVIDSIIAVTQ